MRLRRWTLAPAQTPLLGTMNVLRAAREVGGVERLVHFSTSEAFGSQAALGS